MVATEETEVAGADRLLTAVEASRMAYPVDGSVDIVVLATAFNWPDALGGTALAGTVHGPLLLTPPDALPSAVAAEITRLAPKRVYVLGGTAAVSDDVLEAAKALTFMDIATRLDGADRCETAIEIAAEVKAMRGSLYDGTAFVCTGADFPDALSAAPIAAANGWPIYLTPTDALPGDVADAMIRNDWGGNPSNHGYIIGGTAVVSTGVVDTLDASPFLGFMRIWGPNRYATICGGGNGGLRWSRHADVAPGAHDRRGLPRRARRRGAAGQRLLPGASHARHQPQSGCGRGALGAQGHDLRDQIPGRNAGPHRTGACFGARSPLVTPLLSAFGRGRSVLGGRPAASYGQDVGPLR